MDTVSINSSADSKTETALLNESTCSFGTKALLQIHASNKRESQRVFSCEPASKVCTAEGETGEQSLGMCRRRSRAHSGTAWGMAGSGVVLPPHLHVQKNHRREGRVLHSAEISAELQHSGLDGSSKWEQDQRD